jgi:hypothetical protein
MFPQNRNLFLLMVLAFLLLAASLVPTRQIAATWKAGQNPAADNCANVMTEKISCESKGGYSYTFTVTNNSGGDVQQILLTPPSGSALTLSQQVFNLSPALHNTQSTTLTVNIGNVSPGTKVCFFVTLMSNERPCCTIKVCPDLPNCCATTSVASIRCGANGSYTLVLSIVNTTSNPIQNIYLSAPAGVTMTPSYFAVSLAAGATFQTPPITITGAHPGQLCIHITLHTADMKECCSVDQCIRLPDCDIAQTCANGICCARAPVYEHSTFTGQKIAAATSWNQKPTDAALTVFDLSGANSFNLGTSGTPNNAPPVYNGPASSKWTMENFGSIFGVAIDHLGNIYVTASSAYSNDSFPQGPGRIYKIMNGTGAITNFNFVPLPNSSAAPALGNISFDCARKQFFVTDEEDGKIYRLDMNGTVVGTYDHGTPDNGAAGFAPLGERLWAVKVFDNRIYYSVWKEDCGRKDPNANNEIWSVGLTLTGNFDPSDVRKEITVPDLAGATFSHPVADISFSRDGKMLLSERTMISDTAPSAHESRVLEYACTPSGWALTSAFTGSPYKYNVGVGAFGGACTVPTATKPSNAAGGNDYDYDVAATFKVWATGDALQFNPKFIYGLQGFPLTGGTVTNSALIDLDGIIDGSVNVKTQIGDVAISCPPGESVY